MICNITDAYGIVVHWFEDLHAIICNIPDAYGCMVHCFEDLPASFVKTLMRTAVWKIVVRIYLPSFVISLMRTAVRYVVSSLSGGG